MRLIRNVLIGLTVLLTLVLTGCQGLFGPVTPGAKTVLFNGRDFTGWELFIPDENINVHDVWSVRDGAVYCTGKPNGYMRTEREYKDHHLHVEWRWVAEPANSGVLLHCSGPSVTTFALRRGGGFSKAILRVLPAYKRGILFERF